MRQHVPPEQLWNEFHGDLEFEYEHDVYWPALLRLCEEKHSEQVARWVKAGKNYGESETYLKGGDESSIAGSATAEQVSSEKTTEAVKSEENGSAADTTALVPEEKAPIQSSGTQANGNLEVAAVKPGPVMTTEGDRA